jgi:hypothetical protein
VVRLRLRIQWADAVRAEFGPSRGFCLHPPFGEFPYRRGNIRLGRKLGDQLLDLALGLIHRSIQKSFSIGVGGDGESESPGEGAVAKHLQSTGRSQDARATSIRR